MEVKLQLPLTPRHFKGLEVFMPYRRVALLPFQNNCTQNVCQIYNIQKWIQFLQIKSLFIHMFLHFTFYFRFKKLPHFLSFLLQRTNAEESQKLVNKSHTNIFFLIFFRNISILLNHVFRIVFKKFLDMWSYFIIMF